MRWSSIGSLFCVLWLAMASGGAAADVVQQDDAGSGRDAPDRLDPDEAVRLEAGRVYHGFHHRIDVVERTGDVPVRVIVADTDVYRVQVGPEGGGTVVLEVRYEAPVFGCLEVHLNRQSGWYDEVGWTCDIEPDAAAVLLIDLGQVYPWQHVLIETTGNGPYGLSVGLDAAAPEPDSGAL